MKRAGVAVGLVLIVCVNGFGQNRDRGPWCMVTEGKIYEIGQVYEAGIHQELIMKNGIFNIENLVLDELAADGVNEFLFIFTPTRLKGATGSAGRPIAIH